MKLDNLHEQLHDVRKQVEANAPSTEKTHTILTKIAEAADWLADLIQELRRDNPQEAASIEPPQEDTRG